MTGRPLRRDRLATAAIRAAVAILQASVLFGLRESYRSPADDLIFAPVLMVAIFVPVVAAAGIGELSPKWLLAWMAAAAILCAGLATFAVLRDQTASGPSGFLFWCGFVARLGIILLIFHCLVTATAADRRWPPTAATSRDYSWTLIVRLLLVALATLLAYGGIVSVASLVRPADIVEGAARLDAPGILLLTIGVMHLAFAATTRWSSGVRAIRAVLLASLCWLLPATVVLAIALSCSLFLSGGMPMEGSASAALLGCAALLILLINAGPWPEGRAGSRLLRHARWAGAILIAPLVAGAAVIWTTAYETNGATPASMTVLAWMTIAAPFAAGYGWTAITSGAKLRGLAKTNLLAVPFAGLVLIAISTPLADPARLAVQAQYSRLVSGRVAPDAFDYGLLRFEGARYGREALERLARLHGTPRDNDIAQRAAAVLALTDADN